jgi:hypothetical protein
MDLSADVVGARPATPRAAGVWVAGRRGPSASGVAAAKGAVGLEHDAVRRWTGWSRPSTRAMGAYAWWVVRRAGTLAVDACTKRLPPARARSPLAGFQVRQGLQPHGASPSCGGCGGGWSSPCRRPPSRSSRGPAGAVGINTWPTTITTHVVAQDRGAWQPHH